MDKFTDVNREDRDLLIELRTEMQNVRKDIKELKDGTTKRIESLEKEKADRTDVEKLQTTINSDIEVRMRSLETKIIWIYAFSAGISTTVSFLIRFIIK